MHQSFEERKQDCGGLNLAEPRASETSSVVGALLCGHLSVCVCVCVCVGKNTGSARLQMMQRDVFLKHNFSVVITPAGGRLDVGVPTIKQIFDFQYS